MDKLLLIIKKGIIRLYDINNGKAEIHTVRGEEETDICEYTIVADSLKALYNDDQLRDVEIDVLYTNNDTEIIKSFTEELLPCGGWQVFSFRKVLPEVLLKNGLLKPGGSESIQFDDEAYTVSMSKEGLIEVTEAETGKELSDTDIAAIYAKKFNVFADKEKQECQSRQIQKLKKENEKIKMMLEDTKKLLDDSKKENKNLKDETGELKNKFEKQSTELSSVKEKLKKTVKINKSLFVESRNAVFGASSGKLQWLEEDGADIDEETHIARNVSGSWSCQADTKGILVHIAEDGDVMDGSVIGVIMHKDDSLTEARNWAKKYAQKPSVAPIISPFCGVKKWIKY